MIFLRDGISRALYLFATCAVALVQVAWLCTRFDVQVVNQDSAQLITAARNLLEAGVFATDALFYPEQVALAPPPVPLTVWPPGFSFLMLPLILMGASGVHAAFAVSAVAFGAAVVLTYMLGVRVGMSSPASFLAAVCLSFSSVMCVVTLQGMSEAAYIAATLAAALALVAGIRTGGSGKWIVVAGVLAALACLIRYAGIAWVAAGCLALLFAAPRAPVSSRLKRQLAFAAIPAAAMILQFARNLWIVGTPTGGPMISSEDSIVKFAFETYWSFSRLVGANSEIASAAILGMICIGSSLAVVSAFRWRERVNSAFCGSGFHFLVLLTGGYVAATTLMLAWLTMQVAQGTTLERYYLPLMPFVLLCVIGGVDCFMRGPGTFRERRKWLATAALLVFAGYYLQAQIQMTSQELQRLQRRPHLITALDGTNVNGMTATQYLKRQVRRMSPLTMDDGQRLSAITGIATVGLADSRYTAVIWDEHHVRELMRRSGSCHLLIHVYALHLAGYDNRPFLEALISGGQADWLHPICTTDDIKIYRAGWCSDLAP